MLMNRRRMIATTTAALVVAGRAEAATHLEGRAFGGTWRVVLPEGTPRAPVARALGEVIEMVDAAMSPYRQGSEIARFNRSPATGWVDVSAPTAMVTAHALDLAARTGGAFDPGIGPLVGRYGFGPIRGETGQFDDFAAGPSMLRKARPHLTLDLCGIAKGYALDRIIGALASVGLTDALVELGGEVRAIGRHPSGRDWQVAIEDPTASDGAAQRIVAPAGLALATSGSRWNGIDGQITANHIIDPATGRMAGTDPSSVSVLAATAMEADGLATALVAMGGAQGRAYARAAGISALLLTGGPGALTETLTGDFAEHLVV
jgi:thiamine biosynthesis lipoprotein